MKRLLAVGAWALLLAGCRGQPSKDPPYHLVPDMDWQPKFQAEEASDLVKDDGTPLFADGRAMRPLIEGTVALGTLHEDDAIYRGKLKNADGSESYVARVPLEVDGKLVRRGQERFNIYCSPCHDKTGSGQGMVVKRGYPLPVNLSSDRVLGMPDGEIFNVITNGVRNMPSYRKQIPVEDRWAIITWVRVIERSQHAKLDDVPFDQKERLEPEGAGK